MYNTTNAYQFPLQSRHGQATAPLAISGERPRNTGSALAKQEGLRLATHYQQQKMQDLYVLDERLISQKKVTRDGSMMAGPLAMQGSQSRDIHLGRVESMRSSIGTPEEPPASKKTLQMSNKKEAHQGRTRPDVGAHNGADPAGRTPVK